MFPLPFVSRRRRRHRGAAIRPWPHNTSMNEVSRLARCLYGIRGHGAEGRGKGLRRHGALVAALNARVGARARARARAHTIAARRYRSRIPAFQCRGAHAYPTHGGSETNGEREKETERRSRCLYASGESTNGAAAPSISRSFQKARGAIASAGVGEKERERKTPVVREPAGEACSVVRATSWTREIVGRA